MKKTLEAILFFVAIEAVHFVVLTGALCGVGFFTRADGQTGVSFKQLLWDGGVMFWLDGFGPVVLLCLLVVAVWILWDFIADWQTLGEKRKNLDQEAWQAAQKLVAKLRPELETSIERAYENKYADREAALLKDEERLAWRCKEQAKEQRTLDAGWVELRDERGKAQAWKGELDALRKKAEIAKEKRAQLLRRIRWAFEALVENPPNVGLAIRHLKKAEKE
ncbi:MAG: hypothetical protein LBU45_06590 [Azoarcus sp.]|jgi:hypothetical protein|nr:hypothetical protein [Azoarcus sp.]